MAALAAIAERQQLRLFEPIPRSTEYDKATSRGLPTVALAPKAPGVDAYFQLADEVIAYGR